MHANCHPIRLFTACPYGDQAIGCSVDNCAGNMDKCCKTCPCVSDVPTIDGVSCAVRVNQNGVNHCYNATVSSLCCATCNVSRPSSIANCEYGDLTRNGICSRRQCSVSSVKEQCCQTCAKINSGHCHIPALPIYTLLFVISLLNAGVS
ncbi:sodium-dependent phosphate transporter 1 [Biomphalaria pfeifferi]|uniref:Sodium-dependent phosphate transporter 1 n=1 Tax=Biomphalaria pfeifferi TaxID=112525 RepID=A0AAD8AZF0_BIOPF|nr:sodium-dependent phosphate transporter 1 [Biomphalaria pfeifferi]